jgi:chromosome segregation ATPase
MAKPTKDSKSAIQSLLSEKREVERWLNKLEASDKEAPGHVRDKVKSDYGRRLQTLLEELQGYREELDAELKTHRNLQKELQGREADASEHLAEAELRHTVGEYDEAKWSSIRSEILESLEGIRADLDDVNQEIEGLDEVLAAMDAPAPEDREEVAELDEVPELDAEDAGGKGGERKKTQDEMEFLKSVISGERSAEALAGLSSPKKGSRSTEERIRLGTDGTRQPKRKEHRPSKGSAKKTVKCAECGTLNLPTEWYCENCGAELTAL